MSKEKNRPATAAAPGMAVPQTKKGLGRFIKDLKQEMRHVTWPKQFEVTRLFGVVVSVCVGAIVLLYLLSTAFNIVFSALFRGGS